MTWPVHVEGSSLERRSLLHVGWGREDGGRRRLGEGKGDEEGAKQMASVFLGRATVVLLDKQLMKGA